MVVPRKLRIEYSGASASPSQSVPDASFGFVHMAVALHEMKDETDREGAKCPAVGC
jgi:hypothetical protein